jgi:hypothetical protein
MKKILSEKGNTLIVVLLMIVIFTITGLSLVTATFNGLKKTDARETQIQSTELAEKGIDYLSALIETKAQKIIGLNANDFDIAISAILDPYEVSNAADAFLPTAELPADEGELKVKVYERNRTSTDENDITQVMTLHSEAIVNGKKKTLISKIRLGGKQAPEVLNYAAGTYNPCSGKGGCNSKSDDGNMFLHGGVAVKGDLYVEGNLITSENAIIGTGSTWTSSDFPSVEGVNKPKALLLLKGSLFKSNKNLNYSQHITETNFTKNGYTKIKNENVSSAFTTYHEINKDYVPIVVARSADFAPIDITGQKNQFYFIRGTHEDVDGNFMNNPNQDTIKYRYENEDVYVSPNKNLIQINGSFVFNRLSTMDSSPNRNILIYNDEPQINQLTFKKGAYLGGNVTIGNPNIRHFNESAYHKFEINGPMFIDGDLTIWGANVTFNSTIYVTGKVNVQYSNLEGVNGANQTSKALILFSKGPILMANNSVYKDKPAFIRGFFYTEDMLEVYGVGSNLEIFGGVFGRKIVLNATKGKVSAVAGSNDERLGGNYSFEPVQSPSKSRLRITYNPELIKNPPQGLPIVKDISITKLERILQ